MADKAYPVDFIGPNGPLEWFLWGEEAFEKAENEDRPVLLRVGDSGGLSPNQWEREAFSDLEIIQMITSRFIFVNVDPDMRPDVGFVYGKVCREITGRNDSPFYLFLTPGRKPFFATASFAPRGEDGIFSFKNVLSHIAAAWGDRRQALVDTAEKITFALGRENDGPRPTPISENAPKNAAHSLIRSSMHFPTPQAALFLLAYGQKHSDGKAIKTAEDILENIRRRDAFPHPKKGNLSAVSLWAMAFFKADGPFVSFGEEMLAFLSLKEMEGGGFEAAEASAPQCQKILTGQNCLIAAAFACGYSMTGKAAYKPAARRTLSFIEKNLFNPRGRLLTGRFFGEDGTRAFSLDYVCLLFAILSLYEAEKDSSLLAAAESLLSKILSLFPKNRCLLPFWEEDGEDLIFSPTDGEDGSFPPANALFPLCLLKLFRFTGDVQYKKEAEKIFLALGEAVNETPEAYLSVLYAFLQI